MVEVCAVFCDSSCGWMPRDNKCVYMAHLFMSIVVNVVWVCGNICCVAAVIKDGVLALECWSMLYVCVRGVMDVVFSVCIVTRGAVGARVRDLWVFIMQMLYVCVLCESCSSSQCCILHDLQFVNAGRGWKMRPYGKDILQSRSNDCLIGSHECFLMFTPILLLRVFLSFAVDCVLVLRCCECVCCMWVLGQM